MGIKAACGKPVTDNPYLWQSCTIANIVKREEYTGKKILRKGNKESYKDKRRTPNPKEDWLVFEGAIPQMAGWAFSKIICFSIGFAFGRLSLYDLV